MRRRRASRRMIFSRRCHGGREAQRYCPHCERRPIRSNSPRTTILYPPRRRWHVSAPPRFARGMASIPDFIAARGSLRQGAAPGSGATGAATLLQDTVISKPRPGLSIFRDGKGNTAFQIPRHHEPSSVAEPSAKTNVASSGTRSSGAGSTRPRTEGSCKAKLLRN
jgi:hypothetical protein